MQKSKSKSKGKPTKPTKQTPPKIIDSTEQPALIGELNLNQIDVEVLVREQERLMKLIEDDRANHPQSSKLDNLSTVLLQALHTKDQQLIDFALQKDNPTLIDTTVLNLLSSKIPTLLSSLCQAFVRKPQNTHTYLKWLRSLLKYHVTILFNPSQQHVVKELRKVLEGRTRQIGELARLKGKMSVVLGQRQGEQEEGEGGRARPRVKYVEDVGNQIMVEQQQE